MKRIIIIILAGIIANNLNAQTKWTYVNLNKEGNSYKGILCDDGKELIKPIFQNIVFTDNIFYCKLNEKWGCIDSASKIIIQPIYDDIGIGVSEGLIRVKTEGKWGYIDLKGKTKIKFKYDFACNFQNGKAYVIENDNPMFISKKGEIVETTKKIKDFCPEDIEFADDIFSQFDSDTLLKIKEIDGKFGVIDNIGNIIIPIEYDEIGFYYNDIIEVRKGGLWGAYKNNGVLIVEPKYKIIGLFNNWK